MKDRVVVQILYDPDNDFYFATWPAFIPEIPVSVNPSLPVLFESLKLLAESLQCWSKRDQELIMKSDGND